MAADRGGVSGVKILAFLTQQRSNKTAQYLAKYIAADWDDLMHRPDICLATKKISATSGFDIKEFLWIQFQEKAEISNLKVPSGQIGPA